MFVMHPANDLNLSLKFAFPLTTSCFQLLNRDFFPIGKDSLVHITKPTLPKEVCI